MIANIVLWILFQDEIFNQEYNNDFSVTKIINIQTGCKYTTKYNIWITKLKGLLFESNEHLLINQYKYCKILMFHNSIEINNSQTSEYLYKAIH